VGTHAHPRAATEREAGTVGSEEGLAGPYWFPTISLAINLFLGKPVNFSNWCASFPMFNRTFLLNCTFVFKSY
jgi:hypothetical protein